MLLRQEELARNLARENAIAFTNVIAVPGKPVVDEGPYEWLDKPLEQTVAQHHYLMLDTLQKVSEGKYVWEGEIVRNCMIFMPPGSAKSTYASSVFPAWYLGANPSKQIILTSYGTDLAKKHGRKARQICDSPAYRNVFETGIRTDTRAADEWALDSDSEYMAGGLLSGLTGNRADGLIIDDPVKGKQEAESEAIRESIWNAYEFDADTRLKPGGWKCIIQTRWHEDDLAGRILPLDWAGESGVFRGQDGELWAVICLQAECETDNDPLGRKIGEFIWPEWFPPGYFDRFKRRPRIWRSLFQQVPTAEEGTYFKREWFNYYSEIPADLNTYITLDCAETQDGGDYTFVIVWGVCPAGRIYILNLWRGQVETDVWCKQVVGFVKHYKPLALVPEDDNIFKAVRPFLQKMLRNEKAWCAIQSMPHGSRAKTVRAQSFQGLAGMGLVHLPKDNALAEVLLDQLLKFDAGRYDDGVDACSAFGRYIDKIWEKSPPVEPEEPEPITDRALILEEYFTGNDKKKDEW